MIIVGVRSLFCCCHGYSLVVQIYEDADDPNVSVDVVMVTELTTYQQTIVESYSFKFSYSNGKNGATNGSVEIFRYVITNCNWWINTHAHMCILIHMYDHTHNNISSDN